MFQDDELRIDNIGPATDRPTPVNPESKKKKKEHKPKHKVKDRFHTLAKAAEKTNGFLAQSNSPYRFCVYQKDDEVFIDVVILDEKGKIQSLIKKNITYQEFNAWIKKIEMGDGLIFDALG